MIAAPAVDLREGRCVQWVGGRPEAERVSLPDPEAVARRWHETGFSTLHLVDLDAALGSGDNLPLLQAIAAATPITTQVGGGVREDGRADALIAAGVDRVLVGTRALEDPDWLEALATARPERIMVAADTRDSWVLTRGWTRRSQLTIADFLARLAGLPLAGIITTDVGQEGRLAGIDRGATARSLRWRTHPMWIAGGVTSEDDLAWLEDHGATGAVLGMAIYTGTLDAERVAARWGGHPRPGAGS